MAVRDNKAGLHIVKDGGDATGAIELLLAGVSPSRRVKIIEGDISVPLIGLLLNDHYRLGDLIDAGDKLGRQVSAALPVLWHGATRTIIGAVAPLRAADVVVPRGTLAAWQAQTA